MKTILRKKNKATAIMLPAVKLLYKAAVIKTVILAPKQTHRSMEQNREPSNKPTLI